MSSANSGIMTHVVAGYPSRKDCLELMRQMAAAGVDGIEVQIPFSDPIADGPVIVAANSQALKDGVTVNDAFKMLSEFRQSGYDTPLFVMSYINKVDQYGFDRFCKALVRAKVSGVIVPDLPIDTEEFSQFYEKLKHIGVSMVPVLSPGMAAARLSLYLANKPSYVYVTSTRGITGGKLRIAKALQVVISSVRNQSDAKIIVGFGVRTRSDALALRNYADEVVIGSAVIEQIQLGGVNRAVSFLSDIIGSTP